MSVRFSRVNVNELRPGDLFCMAMSRDSHEPWATAGTMLVTANVSVGAFEVPMHHLTVITSRDGQERVLTYRWMPHSVLLRVD